MAATINPFEGAMKEVNKEIEKRGGNRRRYTRYDCRAIYDKYNGHCSKCGISLHTKSYAQESARFMFRVPLKNGGLVNRDNLLLVCRHCKENKTPKKTPLEERVFGFDSFADLIAQLAGAVVENDLEKIKFFKYEVNKCVAEFVQTLYHKPIGSNVPVERFEGEDTISDLVVDMTAKIAEVFKGIQATHKYEPLRRNKR